MLSSRQLGSSLVEIETFLFDEQLLAYVTTATFAVSVSVKFNVKSSHACQSGFIRRMHTTGFYPCQKKLSWLDDRE